MNPPFPATYLSEHERLDLAIAILAAERMESALDEVRNVSDGATQKHMRRHILRAWSSVRDTNVWNFGSDAFGMLPVTGVDENAYWCWYTALGLELSQIVRSLALQFDVALPE